MISRAPRKISRLAIPQPWSPADATEIINEIAESEFTLHLTDHAKERLEERSLTVGDVLHLLKKGFVYEEAQESTRKAWFKYCMDGVTPNSENRTLRVIVLPCVTPKKELKIITVMWRDEDR
ncbi:MAG: DUF4258 domain-containing protein [Alphaproteobacteria bacterium]|nr:MAG: DUF4258 domain-containing protein [Alphaproteobacteria bacterium]